MQSWGILKTSELSWKACVTLKLPMVSLRMLCYRSWIKTVCECGSLDVRDLCAMVCLSGSPEASLQGAVVASWDRWLSSPGIPGLSVATISVFLGEARNPDLFQVCNLLIEKCLEINNEHKNKCVSLWCKQAKHFSGKLWFWSFCQVLSAWRHLVLENTSGFVLLFFFSC